MTTKLSALRNYIKRKEILILALCFIVGFTLRFYTFDQKSLWIDEVHTFNDSREGIKGQIEYFKDHPADFLHPPLFYLLTHLFYPFEKPERDLRIFPLIFGIMSIPMIYFLAKLFSPPIAFPCTLSFAFMTYHITFSQDGRSYSLLVFVGMAALYFFLRYLKTCKKLDLFLVGFFFSILFYTSYSSIPFIVLSQILWFYQLGEEHKKPRISSFLILNITTLLLCAPWIIFLVLNYKGQPVVDRVFIENLGSLKQIVLNLLNDWVPGAPLTVISILLLSLFPIFSQNRKNAFLLLALVFSPILGLYMFCKIFHINYHFTSRYVINFLPPFLISIFLSLHAIEAKLQRWNSRLRFRFLFLILFIASNLIILPLYYRSEKQDFRGLVSYLAGHLQDGDKIFVKSIAYIPGMLHYFKVYPESRHYHYPVWQDDSRHEILARVTLVGQNKKFAIHFSSLGYARYVADGGRLWIIVGKPAVKETKECSAFVFKGYFDGTVSNFRRFPSDASMYLFLFDPKSPGERGIDLPVE
jgi:uncharacterized membrane protein